MGFFIVRIIRIVTIFVVDKQLVYPPPMSNILLSNFSSKSFSLSENVSIESKGITTFETIPPKLRSTEK